MGADAPTFTPDEIAAGEAMFARPWRFVKSVPSLEFLPDTDRPEMAFAGRSNVGKSSLINALVGHHGLARTSNTPGRTQELNFFEVPHACAVPGRHAGLRLRQGAQGQGRCLDAAGEATTCAAGPTWCACSC